MAVPIGAKLTLIRGDDTTMIGLVPIIGQDGVTRHVLATADLPLPRAH